MRYWLLAVLMAFGLLAGCTSKETLRKKLAPYAAKRGIPPVPPNVVNDKRPAAIPPRREIATPKVATALITLERWTGGRWVVSAPVGNKLQAVTYDKNDTQWFNLANFGTYGNRVTSNVPNTPHMYFRAVPVHGSLSTKAKTVDLDKRK